MLKKLISLITGKSGLSAKEKKVKHPFGMFQVVNIPKNYAGIETAKIIRMLVDVSGDENHNIHVHTVYVVEGLKKDVAGNAYVFEVDEQTLLTLNPS